MPAAMVHGGGGVLLMMTTKFASQETIKKSEDFFSNDCNAVGVNVGCGGGDRDANM